MRREELMRGRVLFGAVALVVLIFAAGGGLYGRLFLTAYPAVPRVTVTERTENRGIGNLVLDIRQPELSGFEDALFERLLNARIRAQVKNAKRDALHQARAGDPDYTFVLTVDYALMCGEGLLSLRVTDDLDNGGTGMPHTVYYNADIQKSALLTLDGLFTSRAYRQAVDALIRKQMEKDAHFFPEDFKGVDNTTAFFVEDGQLHIAFAKYEIASGMAGEPVFAIPTHLIRQYLRPDYAALLR